MNSTFRRICVARAGKLLQEEFSVKMGPTKPTIFHNLAC